MKDLNINLKLQMNKSSILFHIGYHKTGTSWLQKEFFENPVTEINSLAKYNERPKWVTEFVKPFYLYDENKVIGYVNQSYKKNKLNVFSLERLSGYPSTGGYDSLEIAYRLKSLFPNAKVLIVVREQKSMIRSHYIEYLKANGAEKLEELFTPKRFYLIRNPTFNLEFFNYNHLINKYDELFSKDNVLVLPFELMKDRPDLFIDRIFNFCQIKDYEKIIKQLPLQEKVNQQIPLKKAYLNRTFSRLFGSNNSLITLTDNKYLKFLFNKLYRNLPIDFDDKLNSEIDNMLEKYIPAEYFKKSNNILERRINHHSSIDLKQLGYEK